MIIRYRTTSEARRADETTGRGEAPVKYGRGQNPKGVTGPLSPILGSSCMPHLAGASPLPVFCSPFRA
ncbi:MAG: hypothetical protein IJ868_05795, partial [Prevotella sp.]|nr:hypothetical protein [Prevotella sp.]